MVRVGLAGAELGLRGNWRACSQGHLEEEPTTVLRYRALEWGDVAELASVGGGTGGCCGGALGLPRISPWVVMLPTEPLVPVGELSLGGFQEQPLEQPRYQGA